MQKLASLELVTNFEFRIIHHVGQAVVGLTVWPNILLSVQVYIIVSCMGRRHRPHLYFLYVRSVI